MADHETHPNVAPVTDTKSPASDGPERKPQIFEQIPTLVLPPTKKGNDLAPPEHDIAPPNSPSQPEAPKTDNNTNNNGLQEQVDWKSMGITNWTTPHVIEYQKRSWHYSSCQLGSKLKGDWGFSSASASRSHSPSGNGG